MKKILLTLFISTFSIQSFATSCPETPSDTAKSFYFDYLSSYMNGKDDLKKQYIKEYSTEKLISKLKHAKSVSEDYFLKTQDYYDEWLSSIDVKSVNSNNESSNLILTLGETQESYQKLNVKLIKIDGCWKISSVNN